MQIRVDLYKRCPHRFQLVVPREDIAIRVIEDIVIGIRWLLDNEVQKSEVGGVLRGNGFGARYAQIVDGVLDSSLKQLLLVCYRAEDMAFTLLPRL